MAPPLAERSGSPGPYASGLECLAGALYVSDGDRYRALLAALAAIDDASPNAAATSSSVATVSAASSDDSLRFRLPVTRSLVHGPGWWSGSEQPGVPH